MEKIVYQYGALAGMPYTLAKGFREIGVKSINIVPDIADDGGVTKGTMRSNRKLKFDEVLNRKSAPLLLKWFNIIKLIFRIIRTAKLVHYHGSTILNSNLDAYIFRMFGIPTVISWGGGDARITRIGVQRNPYFYSNIEPVKDKIIEAKLRRLAKYKVAVATDPEMATFMEGFFEKVYIYRQPIELGELHCRFPEENLTDPIFMHIPTNPFAKGTVHIENAFKKLKNKGYKFRTILLEPNLTQQELRKKISECDVYVDELRVGGYGVTSIEAAGSGKPTMTFILDILVPKFPEGLPFINTNPDTVYDNLKWLIQNPAQLRDIGLKSRQYIETYHDSKKVVQDLLNLYRELGMK